MIFKQLIKIFLILILSAGTSFAQDKVLINSNNEFGGKTFQSYLEKRTLVFYEYYDANGAKAAEEFLYTEDYPILTDLIKQRIYYKLDKKIKEERFYTPKYALQNMKKKEIEYFDRYSGKRIAIENHFTESHLGYNKIIYKDGHKERIEWYYPDNKHGICKKIFFYDASGIEQQSIVYFTEEFIKEHGYYKKVVIKGSNSGVYLRKKEETWFYTDHYAEQNSDLMRKVIKYAYHPDQKVDIQTYYFDSMNEELMYATIKE